MNAMELTATETQHILPPQSHALLISLSLSNEVLKTLFHTPPIQVQSLLLLSLFSTFFTNIASNPLRFESSLAVSHNRLPKCCVICFIHPADHTTSKIHFQRLKWEQTQMTFETQILFNRNSITRENRAAPYKYMWLSRRQQALGNNAQYDFSRRQPVPDTKVAICPLLLPV